MKLLLRYLNEPQNISNHGILNNGVYFLYRWSTCDKLFLKDVTERKNIHGQKVNESLKLRVGPDIDRFRSLFIIPGTLVRH